MIFDSIVGSARQENCYLGPSIPFSLMSKEQQPLLMISPLVFFDVGIQMIMPSFTALFSDPTWQILSDASPLLRAILLDQLNEIGILVYTP
jgi:hypothetical protein